MILSFPSILRCELNAVLMVPDRSSYGAAPSAGEFGTGSSGSFPNASDNIKLPYAGAGGSGLLAPNGTYDKLEAIARGVSKLAMCDLVSSRA